jgi:hypothetical protein
MKSTQVREAHIEDTPKWITVTTEIGMTWITNQQVHTQMITTETLPLGITGDRDTGTVTRKAIDPLHITGEAVAEVDHELEVEACPDEIVNVLDRPDLATRRAEKS